jgi:CBS domain-containing protein
MTVKAILSGKGNAVITIEPTVPLGDAVKILDEHGIGAAVITDADLHVLGCCPNAISCAPSLETSELEAPVDFATSPLDR